MIITIDGKKLILPKIIIDENGNHIIDKSDLINDEWLYELQEDRPIEFNNVYPIYSINGVKDKIFHKNACKMLYDYYLKHLKADYFYTLLFPEKSKSVYAICVWHKDDNIINDIIKNSLELCVNSRGKWALRLRVNNTNLKNLALKGAVLREYTPQQWNIISNAITSKYAKHGIEFSNLGDLLECYAHEQLNGVDLWRKGNECFNIASDIIDIKTFTGQKIGVQCKVQKCTICEVDTLARVVNGE